MHSESGDDNDDDERARPTPFCSPSIGSTAWSRLKLFRIRLFSAASSNTATTIEPEVIR